MLPVNLFPLKIIEERAERLANKLGIEPVKEFDDKLKN